jgi:hypothetical protein
MNTAGYGADSYPAKLRRLVGWQDLISPQMEAA